MEDKEPVSGLNEEAPQSGAEDFAFGTDTSAPMPAYLDPGSVPHRFADWPVWLVAGVTFLSGLVGIVQPLLARVAAHPRLFSALVPYELYHFSKSLTTAFGFMLIYLSYNLLRKKRLAWMLALSISALSVLVLAARSGSEHFLWLPPGSPGTHLPDFSSLPSVAALLLLVASRKYYTVHSSIRTIRQGLTFVALALCLALSWGTLGFWLLDVRDFGINFELSDALLRTIRQFTLIGNADLVPRTRYAAGFLQSLQILGSLAAVFAAYNLFRPLEYQLATLPHEQKLVKAILEAHGRTALDWYKLLTDKSYFFSCHHDAVIAYKTALNVAISLGDPVGPASEFPELIARFRSYCLNNGWSTAFLQTTPDYLLIYRAAGFDFLKIGEDAVVDLGIFCKKTINKKAFKAPLRKLEKEGYTLVLCQPPHAEQLLLEVESISQEWLSLPGRRERGFSLGSFDLKALQSTPIFVLKDKDGRIIAFVNQVRSYRKGEATIDMMRHRVDVPGGAMDFLFARLFLDLLQQGYSHFSLGLAALGGCSGGPGASLEERAVHQIYEHMNRFFSYKGLRRYKEKFDPSWEERFLVYEGKTPGLIKAAIALARATES